MINWFTVIAQIVNFLILIGLLKYFLYGRIMDVIENRKKVINAQREQTEKNLQASQSELELATEKNRQLDEQREQLLSAVRADVEKFRKQQLEKVRVEVDGVQTRWSSSIRDEQDAFFQELSRRTSAAVCVVARQALNDLAGVNLESRIVSRFTELIQSLGQNERRELIETLGSENQTAIIQTTHELPDSLRVSLVSDLERELDAKFDVKFETLDDLECGIAFQTNSHKLGWNLRDYLTDLENDLRTMIGEEANSRPGPNRETAIQEDENGNP